MALTDAGYALAADMGLVVSKFHLAEGHEALTWDIVTKPKIDVAYHLPVLAGFSNQLR